MTTHATAPSPPHDDGALVSGSELLVRTLVAHGVTDIFGVPGDTGIAFYDALYRRADRIRHVLARDERHAAYMADAYARTTGRLGVCEASSGGGVTYLASGLGEAYASSVPMLVISSDIQRSSRGTGAITEIDQRALFSSVTTAYHEPVSAAKLPTAVAAAIRDALTGRPAPVVLVVPEDVLEDEAPDSTAIPAGDDVCPATRPQAPPGLVASVAAHLASAQRPAVVVGAGVHQSQAWDALVRLADHLAVPVATTINGQAAIADDHPLALGVVGANGARPYANTWLEQADAVMFVGTRANSTDTNGFTAPPRDCPFVARVDVDAGRAGSNYPEIVPLVGDARTVLDQLTSATPRVDDAARDARASTLAAARGQWETATAGVQTFSEADWLDPRATIRSLNRIHGHDGFVVVDAGTGTPNVAAYWQSTGGRRRVVTPRGHGPMGFAMSAAIGVALAHPGDRVLALTTESSFAMGVGDLETAVRHHLPITFVVLDNRSMGWIKMLQHLYLDDRYFGVDPGPIDYVAVARGFGLQARTVTSADGLEEAAKQAYGSAQPALLHVPIPDEIEAPPPVAPWDAVLSGASTERPVY